MSGPLATRPPSETQGPVRIVTVPAARDGQPDSVGLAKVTPNGEIRAIRTRVQLDAAVGHLYDLRGQGGMNISAAGYDHINKALGVSRFMPETTVGDDGQIHANPWIQRDQHGNVSHVTVRICGFGRNAVGNWQLVASTLHYDLAPMLAQDALKKWRRQGQKNGPKVEQDWGKMYSVENVSADLREAPGKKCIAIPGGYVLVVELRGEVLDLIDNHVHRVRFAVRNAETIAWRRVLKVFVGQQKLDPTDLSVSVTAWPQPDRQNIHDIDQMVREAQSGSATLGGEPVAVQSVSAAVDDPEEADRELSGEADEDAEPLAAGPIVEPSINSAQTSPTGRPELDLHRVQIRAAAGQLPEEVVNRTLGEVGLAGMAEVESTGDVRLLKAAMTALSRAVERRKGSRRPGQQELIPGANQPADPG